MKPIYFTSRSNPIVYDKSSANGFVMDTYELSIFWTIMKNKPMTAYDLEKCEYYLHDSHSANSIPEGNIHAYCDRLKQEEKKKCKPKTYYKSYISEVAGRLAEKGLVIKSEEATGPRGNKPIFPTFKGIIYYLQNEQLNGNELFKLFERHNEAVSGFIDSIIPVAQSKHIAYEQFRDAFNDTIHEFYYLRKAKFSIPHLDLSFEAYLEAPKRFDTKRMQYMSESFQKDNHVQSYLQDLAVELRKAYIAYLALHDLEILSVVEPEKVASYAPVLLSEKELAQFEHRDIGSNYLFSGERLKDYFPAYRSLETLFMGMFVKNLLWIKQTDNNQSEKATYCKIEEIFDKQTEKEAE